MENGTIRNKISLDSIERRVLRLETDPIKRIQRVGPYSLDELSRLLKMIPDERSEELQSRIAKLRIRVIKV